MSTLSLLPLVKITDGLLPGEDWSLSLAFYLDDGVTPIPLSGLSFALQVGALAELSLASGQLAVIGVASNILLIDVPAASTAPWASGVYPLTLIAGDSVGVRSLLAGSSLTVGATATARVSLLVSPDPGTNAIAVALPSALATVFQAMQPAAIAASITALPSAQLSELAQALLSALAMQSGQSAPVASGQAFINKSGYVVIAQ